MREKLLTLGRKYEADIIRWRRQLHRFPETGGREHRTAALVEDHAKALGLEVLRVGETNRIAVLETGKPGRTVLLRADMDALPVQENPQNLRRERTVVSEHEGVCHACGHDAHTAMLLGAMSMLWEMREELMGRVLFCFESDEESGSGWPVMIPALEKLCVDRCFALHVLSSLESGVVNIADGPRMSGMVAVDVTFVGKGGHGSRPDLSVNPVFTAAAALNQLAVAAANQVDANETLTLGITTIDGGRAFNVIPDRARVLGSLRYFRPEVGEKALGMLKSVCGHTAAIHGCTVEYGPMTRVYLAPTVNDPACAALARRAVPEEWQGACDRWYASETFSKYLEKWPGALGFLGIRNEALGCGAEHHNGRFDLDEAALWRGAVCHAGFAVEATTK